MNNKHCETSRIHLTAGLLANKDKREKTFSSSAAATQLQRKLIRYSYICANYSMVC